MLTVGDEESFELDDTQLAELEVRIGEADRGEGRARATSPHAMNGRLALVFQRRATGEIEEIDEWWRTNRPSAPDLFLTELERMPLRLR